MHGPQMAAAPKKRGTAQSHFGRPRGEPLCSFHLAVSDQVLEWRRQHPKWGAKTLHTELLLCKRFEAAAIPGISTIGRLLQRKGLTTAVPRRSREGEVDKLPAPERAHQRWQVDAKGNEQVEGVGTVGLIGIKDVFSHCYAGAFPATMPSVQGHPSGASYRMALRLAFVGHGLCEELQCDHDSVFYDNQHPSPFPTKFHLWALALGIKVVFSRRRTPTDQGQVERSHRTVWAQVLQTGAFANWPALYDACQQRRQVLNWHLPCESLGGQPPLQRFPQAAHSGRSYRPEQEWDMLDMAKVDAFLAAQSWQRKANEKGQVKVAKQVYHVKGAGAGATVTITFDDFTRSFCFHSIDGLLLGHQPARGLEKEDLIGEYPLAMPNGFQLQIPFDVQTECLIRLYETPLPRDYES
jgi:transposase InsO family protein